MTHEQSAVHPNSQAVDVFVLDAAEAKLLTELGFIAAYQGDVDRADAVFGGLARVRPGRAYPWIGKALARFHVGRAEEAAMLLEKQALLTHEQDIALLQAWRGMALQLSGHSSQAHSLLEKVAAGKEPGCELARALLGVSQEIK